MYAMNFDITIGPFRLTTLESVVVTRSVENLADTATITLPGAVCSYAPELETMLGEGDPVCIRLGYDARGQELPVEFEGFVSRIGREEGAVKIRCEDGIYRFRRDLKNAVLASVSVKELLEHVLRELGGLELSCDYDFKYDRFAIYETTRPAPTSTCGARRFMSIRSMPKPGGGSSAIRRSTSRGRTSGTGRPGSRNSSSPSRARTPKAERSR